jgi:hypothetical protein
VVAIVLVSDRFLVSHAYLQDSAIHVKACNIAAPGIASQQSIDSALRQAGLDAREIQIVKVRGPAPSKKTEMMRSAHLKGTLSTLGPVKDFDTSGLAGLCGISK